MDTFIISKIGDYYSATKNFELARQIKNKTISKVLLQKCYRNSTYIVYVIENSLKTISLPIKREKTDYPELNYKDMINKAIKNLLFFYQMKTQKIHVFQHLPYKHLQISVDENIEEANFCEIDEYTFILNVNHTHLYTFEKFKLVKKIPLAQGFFFEETIFENIMYSQFFGNELIVQDLDTLDEFRLKFKGDTYYDFISKDLVIIDFAFVDDLLPNALPNNNLEKEAKKNCLFKFHLIKGSPNSIGLEFVAFLPKELKIHRIDFKNGLYWSKIRDEKIVTIWKKDNEVHQVYLEEYEKATEFEKIDSDNILVKYNQQIDLIDVESGKILKFDITQKIENVKAIGTVKKVGDYFNVTVNTDLDSMCGWKQFVMDMNFNIVYQIDREIFRNYCFPY